jgi:hypothetical protein
VSVTKNVFLLHKETDKFLGAKDCFKLNKTLSESLSTMEKDQINNIDEYFPYYINEIKEMNYDSYSIRNLFDIYYSTEFHFPGAYSTILNDDLIEILHKHKLKYNYLHNSTDKYEEEEKLLVSNFFDYIISLFDKKIENEERKKKNLKPNGEDNERD